MLSDQEKQYLAKRLERGDVSLFLGAGFSRDFTNKSGTTVPTARQLVEKLWTLLKYEGQPSESDTLQNIYEVALKRASERELKALLDQEFSVTGMPEWAKILPKFIWRKIYTTNIDNAVEYTFSSVGTPVQRLRSVNAMKSDYLERDQSLIELQKVALHGDLSSAPRDVTFGTLQYSSRINTRYDPWYSDFTSEYTNTPFIFVGSQLEEQILWAYLEARGRRTGAENRPRSFLVTKSLPQSKKDLLEEFNIKFVESGAEEFFEWLDGTFEKPTLISALERSSPQLLQALDLRNKGAKHSVVEAANQLFSSFQIVKPEPRDPGHSKKTFLNGAIPTWQDIAHDLDAPRDITQSLRHDVEAARNPGSRKLVIVDGHDGAGKSTIARRLSWTLASNGIQTLFCESGLCPSEEYLREAFSLLKGKCVFVIDDAHKSIGRLSKFVKKAVEHELDCVFVLFSRSSGVNSILDALEAVAEPIEHSIGDLSRSEIDGLISRLDLAGLLGKLQGLNPQQRIREFEDRARKQILVAMKEATHSERFDEIIRNEYSTVESEDARRLYLLASLAASHGHAIHRRVLVGAFQIQPSRCLELIKRDLRNILIDFSGTGERFFARHQLIATEIVDHASDKDDLLYAYLEFLSKLVPMLGRQPSKRSKDFRLYKSLIKHDIIYRRFEEDLGRGERIYEHIKSAAEHDYHFWLQYSSFELSRRNYSLAKTYIEAAQSILDADGKHDSYVALTNALIGIQHSIYDLHGSVAKEQFSLHVEMLEQIISDVGNSDPYPFHVLGRMLRLWVRRNESNKSGKVSLLEKAKRTVERGLREHPRNGKLKELLEYIRRDELLAIANKAFDTPEDVS